MKKILWGILCFVFVVVCIILLTDDDNPSFSGSSVWIYVGENENGVRAFVDANSVNQDTQRLSYTATFFILTPDNTSILSVEFNCARRTIRQGPTATNYFNGERTSVPYWDDTEASVDRSRSFAEKTLNQLCGTGNIASEVKV